MRWAGISSGTSQPWLAGIVAADLAHVGFQPFMIQRHRGRL